MSRSGWSWLRGHHRLGGRLFDRRFFGHLDDRFFGWWLVVSCFVFLPKLADLRLGLSFVESSEGVVLQLHET